MDELPNIEYLRERTRVGPETPQNWLAFLQRGFEYLTGQIEGTVPAEVRSTIERLPEAISSSAGEYDPKLMLDLAGMGVGSSAGVGGLGAGPRLPKGFRSLLLDSLEKGKAGKFDLGNETKAGSLLSLLRKGGVSEDELEMTGVGRHLMRAGQEKVKREDVLKLAQENYPNFEMTSLSGRAQHERDALYSAIVRTEDRMDWRDARSTRSGEPLTSDDLKYKEKQFKIIDRLDERRKTLARPEYENWSTKKGEPITLIEGKPEDMLVKQAYEERLLSVEAPGAYRSTHWSGKNASSLVGHSRIDELRLVVPHMSGHDRFEGPKVTHIDEIQSDWNITASKHEGPIIGFGAKREAQDKLAAASNRWQESQNEYLRNPTVETFTQQRAADNELMAVINAGNMRGENEIVGPPIRSGNIERTLVRDVVKRAWEKGSDGITWTTAEMQAERYGRLVDEVRWSKVGPETGLDNRQFVTLYATKPGGQRVHLGEFHRDEIKDSFGSALDEAIKKNSERGVLPGRRMFRVENYQKTYDTLLPRIFREEYGVTPEKRKIFSPELNREVEVWYAPLTDEMKKKAFKGQKFALMKDELERMTG